jgi:hypothetical protein
MLDIGQGDQSDRKWFWVPIRTDQVILYVDVYSPGPAVYGSAWHSILVKVIENDRKWFWVATHIDQVILSAGVYTSDTIRYESACVVHKTYGS